MQDFDRNYDDYLVKWKVSSSRRPLLIAGARQVGKTNVVKKFGKKHYKNVLELNFMRDKNKLLSIFEAGLSPSKIIENAQLLTGQAFDAETDLLVFEEVGFSQEALTSLKFFCEQAPHIHLVATGSNIGLFKNFPVGQTHRITMYPMTFREFLMAQGKKMLVRYVDTVTEGQIPSVAHEQLIEQLINYWFVGGMPGVVQEWISFPDSDPINRIKAVKRVQSELLKDYQNDFGKLSEDHDATTMNIKRVYDAVATRIADVEDGNAKKFKFKGIYGSKHVSYDDVASPIDFLECLMLVHRVFILDGVNNSYNMNFQKQENMFKLLPHDVGLMCRMIGMEYQELREKRDAYKGYIAEVFVLNEFLSCLVEAHTTEMFSFKKGHRMELEYLLKSPEYGVVPVEVKSGTSTRAASLNGFIDKYSPTRALKFSAKNPRNVSGDTLVHLPLYLARAAYVNFFCSNEDIL
jgi:uncharacterized protein